MKKQLAMLLVMGTGFLAIGLTLMLVGIQHALWPPPNAEWTPLLFSAVAAPLFGLPGLALTALAFVAWRDWRALKQAEQEWPGRPWRWRQDWSRGVIRDNAWTSAWGAIGLAFWVNLFTFGAAAIFQVGLAEEGEDLGARVGLGIISGAFCLIFFGFAVRAAQITIQAFRWSESQLELIASPIALGQQLIGAVSIRGRRSPGRAIFVTISCVEQRSFRHAIAGHEVGQAEPYDEPLYQATRRVDDSAVSHVDDVWRFPVFFAVPEDTRASSDSVTWRLSVSSREGPLGYESEFELPVFRLDRQLEIPDRVDSRLASCMIEETLADSIEQAQGQVLAQSCDRIELEFSSGRERANVVFPYFHTCFFIGWFAISATWCVLDPGLMSIGFVAIGLIALYAVIADRMTSYAVTVEPNQVRCAKRIFGLGRERAYAASEIKQIEARQLRPRSGFQFEECVVLETNSGKSWILIDRLPDRAVGIGIAKQLTECLVSRPTPKHPPRRQPAKVDHHAAMVAS